MWQKLYEWFRYKDLFAVLVVDDTHFWHDGRNQRDEQNKKYWGCGQVNLGRKVSTVISHIFLRHPHFIQVDAKNRQRNP